MNRRKKQKLCDWHASVDVRDVTNSSCIMGTLQHVTWQPWLCSCIALGITSYFPSKSFTSSLRLNGAKKQNQWKRMHQASTGVLNSMSQLCPILAPCQSFIHSLVSSRGQTFRSMDSLMDEQTGHDVSTCVQQQIVLETFFMYCSFCFVSPPSPSPPGRFALA